MPEVEMKITNFKIELERYLDGEVTFRKIDTPNSLNIYLKKTIYLREECQQEIRNLLHGHLRSINSKQECEKVKANLLQYFDKQTSMNELFHEGQFFDREKYCLVCAKAEFYDFI